MNEIDIQNSNLEITRMIDYKCWSISNSRFSSYDLNFNFFFKNYLVKNVPCLIKDVGSNWACTTEWVKDGLINYDYFSEKYGDLDVPVADCNTIEFNSQCKSNMKVKEYMNYLRNNTGSVLLYLKDWHLKRNRPKDTFYEVPPYFVLDWLNEYAIDNNDDDFMFVYIGPEGSWTPLHEDVYCSYSWSVNVIGRKKWILFPPGEEEKLKDSFGNLPLLFDPVQHENVKYFEIIQEQGEVIFVPSGWHHQVVNEINTISINHNWINACNIDIVWEALLKCLTNVENQIEEFKDTPEFPSQCQLMLKSLFGMDVKSFIELISHIAKKRLTQINGNYKTIIGKYFIGRKIIEFDLKSLLRVMDLICDHPIFLNKQIILNQEEDFLKLKIFISNTLIKK